MAIICLFQCDPWCLPTQNWLKNFTNDISIHEFLNVTRHYVKDTGNYLQFHQGSTYERKYKAFSYRILRQFIQQCRYSFYNFGTLMAFNKYHKKHLAAFYPVVD